MRFAILASALLLAACGFRPLHSGTNTLAGDSAALDQVYINTIPEAWGLYLRNALIDRFYNSGMPGNPRYILAIRLTQYQRTLAIRKNDTATRAQWVTRANYQLVDRQSNKTIDRGDIRAIASYNILSSQYTTMATQDDARQASLRELADKITLRIGIVLQQSVQ